MGKICNLVLVGPPSGGKGYAINKLKEMLGAEKVQHISTGELLRNRIKVGDDVARELDIQMQTGKLVDQKYIDLVLKEVFELKDENIVVRAFDGYPRSSDQANTLMRILEEKGEKIDILTILCLTDEELYIRVRGRRECPVCKKTLNVELHPPKVDEHCDVCNSLLVKRADDNMETYQRRLNDYNEYSKAVINALENSKQPPLIHVNMGGNGDKLAADIVNLINQMNK